MSFKKNLQLRNFIEMVSFVYEMWCVTRVPLASIRATPLSVPSALRYSGQKLYLSMRPKSKFKFYVSAVKPAE